MSKQPASRSPASPTQPSHPPTLPSHPPLPPARPPAPQVMVLSQEREKGRVSLCTKKLEPTPGDMLRDPALVYEKAEEMAALFRERVAAAEAAARAEDPSFAAAPEGSQQ